MTEQFTHEIVTMEDGTQFDLVRDARGRLRAVIDSDGVVVMHRYYTPDAETTHG